MLNYSGLVDRLQLLIKENELTASSFADKIGVQRSSISHILSGRNKPSLDFLAKIEHNFEQISFHWLLTGEELPSHSPAPQSLHQEKMQNTFIEKSNETSTPQKQQYNAKEIVDLIYVYSDGSFQRFHPNS